MDRHRCSVHCEVCSLLTHPGLLCPVAASLIRAEHPDCPREGTRTEGDGRLAPQPLGPARPCALCGQPCRTQTAQGVPLHPCCASNDVLFLVGQRCSVCQSASQMRRRAERLEFWRGPRGPVAEDGSTFFD